MHKYDEVLEIIKKKDAEILKTSKESFKMGALSVIKEIQSLDAVQGTYDTLLDDKQFRAAVYEKLASLEKMLEGNL